MFNITRKLTVDRLISEYVCNRYTPPSLNLVIEEKIQIFIDIPREDSVIPLKVNYLDIYGNLNLTAGADNRFLDGDNIRLVNQAPLALFNKYRLTSSSGRELQEVDNAHVFRLMHKLISSIRDSEELSIGFQKNIEARERELTNNKTTKGKYYVRIYLKDVFGFAEHQDNCTYGLGQNLTLQRNSENHLLGHRPVVDNAAILVFAGRVIIEDLSWFSALYAESSKEEIEVGAYCI